jgi:hypothetical protein
MGASDTYDLNQLIYDFTKAGPLVEAAAATVMKTAAHDVKRRMVNDFHKSEHFTSNQGLAESVTYDQLPSMSGVITYEVGPDYGRRRAAALAGIAYFGGARGGGGTVPEPGQHADTEMRAVGEYLAAFVEKTVAP